MRIVTAILAASFGIVAVSAAFAQYKYTTPDGRTVYSDQPPPASARGVQRREFGAGGSAVDTATLPYELRRATENFPVTLFTTPKCGPCDSARTALRTRGIPFVERTITTDADIEALKARGFGGSAMPAIAVGSTKLESFDEGAWQSTLTVAGYPTSSRLPANYANPAPSALAPPAPSAAAPDATDAPKVAPPPPPAASEAPAPPGFRF